MGEWLAWDPVRMIDLPEYREAWRSMSYIYMDCGLWDELNFRSGPGAVQQAQGGRHRPRLRAVPGRDPDVQYRNDISLPRLAKAIGA